MHSFTLSKGIYIISKNPLISYAGGKWCKCSKIVATLISSIYYHKQRFPSVYWINIQYYIAH